MANNKKKDANQGKDQILLQRISELESEIAVLKQSKDTQLTSQNYPFLDLIEKDIVYRLDTQGKILFINDAVRPWGYEPSQLIGTNILDYVHPEDRKTAKYRLNERRTGDRSTRLLEIRLFSPTETIEKEHSNLIDTDAAVFLVTAEGLYTSEKPKTDSFMGTQGYARDISEIKVVEDKLRLALFSTDKGPDSLLWVDGDSRIVYANEASCASLGYTRDELLHMTIHDIDPDFTREMMIKHIEEMKKYKKMTI